MLKTQLTRSIHESNEVADVKIGMSYKSGKPTILDKHDYELILEDVNSTYFIKWTGAMQKFPLGI